MIDMRKCIICGTSLSESIIKNKQRKCYNCCDQEHLNVLLSHSNLDSIFCKKWSINLLTKYNKYLIDIGLKLSLSVVILIYSLN